LKVKSWHPARSELRPSMIRDQEKIKAVIFDWGGVCCKEGEPFASLDLQYTLAMTPEQIATAAKALYDGYYIGAYDRKSFWRAIIAHFGLKENATINPDALSKAYLDSYEIYPDVFATLRKLKKKYLLGLLSNLTPEMRDEVHPRHALDTYFDAMVYSCDDNVRSMKPAAKPYEIILGRLHVKPKECLFIDNSPANISAAQSLCFQTMLFISVSRFLEDIAFLL